MFIESIRRKHPILHNWHKSWNTECHFKCIQSVFGFFLRFNRMFWDINNAILWFMWFCTILEIYRESSWANSVIVSTVASSVFVCSWAKDLSDVWWCCVVSVCSWAKDLRFFWVFLRLIRTLFWGRRNGRNFFCGRFGPATHPNRIR